jgi:DNA-binding GntR family transcriptional regulator
MSRKSIPTSVAVLRSEVRAEGLAHADAAVPPHPSPTGRLSLAEKVRVELLTRILDGTIRPGERIIELRVAEEFGTSQAPVREALRALEVLGVVEASPNRGARARVLDSRELAEISDVRAELEGYAASLAALSFEGNTAELEAYVETMRRAAKASDVRRFAEANAAFHRLIVRFAGNATLLDIWSLLNVKAHTVMNVLRSQRDLSLVADSHIPIVAALNDGDARAARRATRAHVIGNKLRQ